MSDINMKNWSELLERVAKGDKITSCTLSPAEMQVKFYVGYGSTCGKPFTAWSGEWVYFPAANEGIEWVSRAPRNPCGVPTRHIGE